MVSPGKTELALRPPFLILLYQVKMGLIKIGGNFMQLLPALATHPFELYFFLKERRTTDDLWSLRKDTLFEPSICCIGNPDTLGDIVLYGN